MQAPIKTATPQAPSTLDEMILVVKRNKLLPATAWHGLKQENLDKYLAVIKEQKEFIPRQIAETDLTYKQIIPYLVFEHDNRYFLMQRQDKATETRLQNKFSLGIGGHIREEDLKSNSLFDWARREFHEEVNYLDEFTIEPLGILNDDSNAVGQVHIGFVFLLHGKSNKISVKSELKSGKLLSLEECEQLYDKMESWSKIVFDCLKHRPTK